MATHSSTLAWKLPWMEEPGRLQSMGSLRVGYDWATSLSLFLSCIGEGNGNPLQCSCLENPKDGGASWAAVYGRVTQSWTQLKRLSSSKIFFQIFWDLQLVELVTEGQLYFNILKTKNKIILNIIYILFFLKKKNTLDWLFRLKIARIRYKMCSTSCQKLRRCNRITGASQVAQVVKNTLANAGDVGVVGLISRLGRSPGGGSGSPLRYSYLDRGTWWAKVHRVTRSRTWTKWFNTAQQDNMWTQSWETWVLIPEGPPHAV